MRVKTFLAALCLTSALTLPTLAGIIENPPAPTPPPPASPTQNNTQDGQGTNSSTEPSSDADTSDILIQIFNALIPYFG